MKKTWVFFRLARGYFFLFQIVSVLSNGFSLVERDWPKWKITKFRQGPILPILPISINGYSLQWLFIDWERLTKVKITKFRKGWGWLTQSNKFPEGGVLMAVWCGNQNRIISNVYSFFYFLNLKTYVSILLHFNLRYISCLISSENLLLNQTIFLTEYFSSVSFTFLSEVKEITIKELCDGYSIFPVQTLIQFCCRPIHQITPRMWFLILPCSCYTFPSKLVTRIRC